METNLPDEYASFGAPFKRSTRPRATISEMSHVLPKHTFDSPRRAGVTRFPKGTFGTDDDDVLAVVNAVDQVTYYGEPIPDEQDETVIYFQHEVNGVIAEVPVRQNEDGDWETRTIYPVHDWGV